MKKIFVVDDSDFDRSLLSKILKKRNFEVVGFHSGTACVEAVEKEKPDLILLDILMPGMQGDHVLHVLRKKFSAIELPIIMISAKSDASDVIELLHLGANDYIIKPLDLEVALTRINTQLKIAELSKEAVRLQEVAAIGAMVATYNHEINNPLAIALGALTKITPQPHERENFKRLETALWRVAEIVKKISEVSSKGDFAYENYTETQQMINIKQSGKR